MSQRIPSFLKYLKKTFDILHVVVSERVELAAYKLKGIPRFLFDQWKRNRVKSAPMLSCVMFYNTFRGRFIPHELQEAKIRNILTLNPYERCF